MSYDYGPLQTYEITWTSGHVERVQCHQVTFHSQGPETLDAIGAIGVRIGHTDRRILMYGMFGGHWRLALSAIEGDIRAIRLITGGEEFAGERFDFTDGADL